MKPMVRRAAIAVLLLGVLAAGFVWRRRLLVAAAIESQRVEIVALEAERKLLQERLDILVPKDKDLVGMPKTALRFGIPTSLTRDLVKRVTAGLVDQVTLVLEDLHFNKTGTIKKVVAPVTSSPAMLRMVVE